LQDLFVKNVNFFAICLQTHQHDEKKSF
jgi:hypothetical protein